MSSLGPVLLDLAGRSWSELDQGERAAYAIWLHDASGEDLHLMLHEARRRWRRPRKSSSATLAAYRESISTDPEET